MGLLTHVLSEHHANAVKGNQWNDFTPVVPRQSKAIQPLAEKPASTFKEMGFKYDDTHGLSAQAFAMQPGSYANPIKHANQEKFISTLQATHLPSGQTAYEYLANKTKANVEKAWNKGPVTYQSLSDPTKKIFPMHPMSSRTEGKTINADQSGIHPDVSHRIEIPNGDGTTHIIAMNEFAAQALQAKLMGPAVEAMLAKYNNRNPTLLQLKPIDIKTLNIPAAAFQSFISTVEKPGVGTARIFTKKLGDE